MHGNDGFGLSDSYLFTNLSQESSDFIRDNEKQLIAAIEEMVAKQNCVITLEVNRKDITVIEVNYARQF